MAQLYEFLIEAELQQYYTPLTSKLNLSSIVQIKQSNDEDLTSIGMTRPEIRRLKKFLKKHGQQGPLTKLKRIWTKGPEELKPSANDGSSVSVGGNRLSSDVPCDQTVIVKRSAVTIKQELGTGEFGTVHYGTWKTDDGNKMQVSLKIIKQTATRDISGRFLEYMSSIQRLNHPHLVRLYGVVTDGQETFVVSELAPMKSLADCLNDPGNRTHFPVSSLCDFAVQIANGMNYLESNNFVHRDLAARNVLVFSKDLAKICDHGLTQALDIGLDYYQKNVSISLKLPIAWCAPECIEKGQFTSASDVWSYGVTLWEMFSYGFQPWAGFTGAQIASAVGETEDQRLNQPERCPKEFYDLMLTCWKRQREERPKFAQILERLQMMKVTRHIANKECTVARSDCLSYSVGDVFTLLDKSSPIPGFWKGIHESSNKTGFFNSADTLPFIESQHSEVLLRKGKVNRKESDRKSLRPGQRLHISMISGPQNDLRHVGHVGYDGVMFGDVACLDIPQDGSNAKSLPPSEEAAPLPVGIHSDLIRRSCSNSSMVSDVTSVVTSIISSDTLTDVSSMHEDCDSRMESNSDDDFNSLRQDSPIDDLGEFRIPDISNTFDLGPSLMDEVMRAFGNSKSEKSSNVAKVKTEDAVIEKSSPTFTLDDKKRSPAMQSSAASPSSNGRLNKEAHSTVCKKIERESETVEAVKTNKVESDLMKKLDPKINQPTSYLNHESLRRLVLKEQTADHDISKADPRIPCQPPAEIERIRQGRDMGRDARSSLPTSHLSDSQSSLKNGILSKIGGALGRRGSSEQKILQSLDTLVDPNPAVSSSAEFALGARKYSATSSSSLPMHKGGFDSLNSSVLTVNDEDASSNVIRRTKEKIRSSVASVMSKRSSLKNPRLPPPQNLNVNTLFFDRLREQEMENAEIKSQNSLQNDETGLRENISSSVDDDAYVTSTLTEEKNGAADKTSDSWRESDALRDPLYDASADSDRLCSKKRGTATTCDSVVSDRCPSVVSQDSLHISECSSVTHQSSDSCYTDDSGTAHVDPITRVVPADLDAEWDRSSSDLRSAHLFSTPICSEPSGGPTRVKTTPFSEEIASDLAPSVKLIDSCRSSRNEEIESSIQLVSSSVPGVHLEDCMYALSDTNWDASRAILVLRLQQRLGFNRNDSQSCRSALESCNWDLESAFRRLTEPSSGRESPELVHV